MNKSYFLFLATASTALSQAADLLIEHFVQITAISGKTVTTREVEEKAIIELFKER